MYAMISAVGIMDAVFITEVTDMTDFNLHEQTQPNAAGGGAIKIIARMPVAESKVEEFKAAAAELVRKSREEPGNIYYCLNVDTKNPCMLAFIECWRDQAAIDYHRATEHFTRILPQLAAMCDGKPIKELYREIEY